MIEETSDSRGGFKKLSFFHITLSTLFLLVILYLFNYLENIEQHLSNFFKIFIGWGFLSLMIIFNKMQIAKRPPLRFIFILISAAISLRYLIWRTTQTLIFTGPFDFAGMVFLYFAEVYALLVHFIGMFVNIWPIDQKVVPLPDDLALFPTVDVFIPTYNESEEIVRLTATAATLIDYPKDKMNIYILNDGSTVAKRNDAEHSSTAWDRHYRLRKIANELGVHYLTREQNDHAKAGNINHALKFSSGDLVLILDCDHVPTRDILKKTTGWFLRDKKLFLVQTPHFFINQTPVERSVEQFSNLPGENDMFYRVIHHGLDFWNSSYFCGSAAVLRRKFLEEVGGISGETITEDAETSLSLHNRGYSSVYIDRPMVCGLSPDSFDDYIVQRSRWAQGMMQLFILKNPLFAKGLTLHQRLCYFNSCFFWFFGFTRFVFYIVPSLFLIFGLRVYHASSDQILLYALPHVIGAFITMDFFYGNARKPFFSEIYESVQSIFLMPAILAVIFNPKKPVFKITPKGTKVEKNFMNPLAVSFVLMVLVNLIAMPFAIHKWINYPLYRDVILITGAWCLFNLFMSIISLGAFWEKKQVRSYHRLNTNGTVNVFFPRLNHSTKGEIRDVSMSGMGFEVSVPFPLELNEKVLLEVFDSYGERYEFQAKLPNQVITGDKIICGAEYVFDKESYVKSVEFVYGDSQRWQNLYKERANTARLYTLLIRFMFIGLIANKDLMVSLIKAVIAPPRVFLRTVSKAIHIFYKTGIERIMESK